MYHLYVDETGNTSAGASNRHTQRYLNLTGVIVSDQAKSSFENQFDAMRAKHFDHRPDRPIVLHRVKLNSGRGIYSRLQDEEKCRLFRSDFVSFLSGADFSAITVTMDKVAFYYHHESWTGEPYEFCAFNMIERFCLFLIHRGAQGTVTAENRNPKQDELFRAAFEEFCASGTKYISAGNAQHRLGHTPVSIPGKHNDVIGCQVADFLCQPMLEGSIKHFRGKGDASEWHRSIIRATWPKLYRGKGNKLTGCGLVWRPNPVKLKRAA